jgi:hypothetical protein
LFKSLGVTSVALLDHSDPQDATAFPIEQAGVRAVGGLKICYGNDTIPIGTVNMTIFALAMKNNHCPAMDFSAVESTDIAIAAAIQQWERP